MNATLPLLALALGFSGLGHAQDLERQVEFKLIYAVSTGDPLLNDNPLARAGTLARLDLALFTDLFPTDEPPSIPYTSTYIVPGSFDLLALDGSGFAFSTGAVNIASITNDHPGWDAVAFVADTVSSGGAHSSGETVISGASLVLSDSSRTALASTALLPMPAFSAFSSGEVALRWFEMPDEEIGFQGSQSLALGRVTSIDEDPDRPAYRCEGFAPPAQRKVTLGNEHRRLQLAATLIDSDRKALGPSNLVSRPILRVLNLGSFDFVTSLAADEGAFHYRGGRWTHALQAEALPGPGTYLVYLTSPDSDEYVFDQLCTVEVTVTAADPD